MKAELRIAYLWDCPACKGKNMFAPDKDSTKLKMLTDEEAADSPLGELAVPADQLPEEALEVAKGIRFIVLPDEVTCQHCLQILPVEKAEPE